MALIPIDVALGGINSIRGLFGANEADKERARQLKQAEYQRRMAIDALAKDSADAFREFQRREQAGEFDPKGALDLIGRTSAENLGNVLKNFNVGPMGEYRRGDTPREMAARIATTEGLQKEQADRLNAELLFEDRRQQALDRLNQIRGREANARFGVGTEFAREGMAMPGNNLQSYLGNLVSMMPKAEKSKPKATAGYNPPAPSQAPFGSQMNWQKDVSEVTDIPLSGIINTLRYAR
jgi:hypothetical protein